MVVTTPAATFHPVAEDSTVGITTIEEEKTTTSATRAEEEAGEASIEEVGHLRP